ncbi:hypothetical protein VP01_2964g3, partial [Puccinia sorghi]
DYHNANPHNHPSTQHPQSFPQPPTAHAVRTSTDVRPAPIIEKPRTHTRLIIHDSDSDEPEVPEQPPAGTSVSSSPRPSEPLGTDLQDVNQRPASHSCPRHWPDPSRKMKVPLIKQYLYEFGICYGRRELKDSLLARYQLLFESEKRKIAQKKVTDPPRIPTTAKKKPHDSPAVQEEPRRGQPPILNNTGRSNSPVVPNQPSPQLADHALSCVNVNESSLVDARTKKSSEVINLMDVDSMPVVNWASEVYTWQGSQSGNLLVSQKRIIRQQS